jgi:hypothetical protein
VRRKARRGKAWLTSAEILLAHTFEFAALLTVLERRGMLTQGEVLEESKRMQEEKTRATVRPFHLAVRRVCVRRWTG